jgi:hypothetical protein
VLLPLPAARTAGWAPDRTGDAVPPHEEPAQAQDAPAPESEIVTDRPDITEFSIVIPTGSVQAENGLTWTAEHSKRTVDAPQSLLRVGVGRRTEVRLGIPDYVYGLGRHTSRSGFTDVSVGVKQQLGPLPGAFDLSVISAISFPTGAHSQSSRGVDLEVKFPWSHALSYPWSMGGMFSVFSLTEEGRRNLIGEPTFYVERAVGTVAELFAEYAGDYRRRGSPTQLLHLGGAYKVRPLQQVDVHWGVGLSRAAPDVFVAIGYSFRLDRLF